MEKITNKQFNQFMEWMTNNEEPEGYKDANQFTDLSSLEQIVSFYLGMSVLHGPIMAMNSLFVSGFQCGRIYVEREKDIKELGKMMKESR